MRILAFRKRLTRYKIKRREYICTNCYPNELRMQQGNQRCFFIMIIRSLLEIRFYTLEDVLDPYATYDQNIWDILEEQFCREKGLKGMGHKATTAGYGKSSIEIYFSISSDTYFLDAINFFFYIIDVKLRTINLLYTI